MRLYSFEVASPLGSIARIGAERDGALIDLNGAAAWWLHERGEPDAPDYAAFLVPPDMITFLSRGDKAMEAARETLEFTRAQGVTGAFRGPRGERIVYGFEDVHLMAPIPRPNLVWDAMVFLGHIQPYYAREGMEVPEVFYDWPCYTTQSGTVVAGPYDPIFKPRYTEQLDFEVELGVYIGRKGINIAEGDAGRFIAGYTIFNDVSARDVQFREQALRLGPAKGKNFEHASIMGPCMVTPDEVDAANLRMIARVNGEVVTDDNSRDMYHGFGKIIERISEEEYLYPGDFMASGTTVHGSCMSSTLGRWLEVGDVVEVEIEGIGSIRNEVVPAPDPQTKERSRT